MEGGERKRRRSTAAGARRETETPETGVASDGVEGINVGRRGEGHHLRASKNKSRRQRDAPGEESEENKSPKTKIIRVECEETQDYVREAKSTDHEELSFVASAIIVPQKLMFRCDNQCSEQNLSFWQKAQVVKKEGEESFTTNICQKCYNDFLKAKGENTDKLAVETVHGAKGASWKALDNGK